MKSRLSTFLLLLSFLLLSGMVDKNEKNTDIIVLYGENYVGCVEKDKIEFYKSIGAGEWEHRPEATFSIPAGTTQVFGFSENYVGIANRHELRFFEYKPLSHTWTENVKLATSAVPHYTNLFPVGFKSYGLVDGQNVSFYTHLDTWKKESRTFSIKGKFKKVFSFNSCLGIVYANRIEFYEYKDNTWNPKPELAFSVLPNTQDVYSLLRKTLAVKIGNRLHFHSYKDQKWKEEKSATFPLGQAAVSAKTVEDFTIVEDQNLQDVEEGANIAIETPVNLDENQIFTFTEEPPKFPGGDAKMLSYIKDNVKHPVKSDTEVMGTLIVSFVVEKDGSMSDIKELKGIRGGSQAFFVEAKRVLESMPKWMPARMNGKPVRCMYTMPIKFSLN